MTRDMQVRLVAALRSAMDAQDITQKDIARHVGTSVSTISTAFSGKDQMNEERWRMACEFCGVDFDAFMDCQITPQSACADSSPENGSLEETVGAATGRPLPQSKAPVHEEVDPMPLVMKNTVSVELTPSQCLTLKNFIEDEIFSVIRSDNEIDSFAWLHDIMCAHSALVKAVTLCEKPAQ